MYFCAMQETLFSMPVLEALSVVSINHRNAHAAQRGEYALCPEAAERLLLQAGELGLTDCLVLSTCNRTEVYGIAPVSLLMELLASESGHKSETLCAVAETHSGEAALQHLFRVSSGLESKIVGDYEILSQIKKSAALARKTGMLSTFFERLLNFALQASKKIKTHTLLSTGTVSAGFAALELIREYTAGQQHPRIMLLGVGQFGKGIGKNIREYLPEAELLVCNRTDARAQRFTELFGGHFLPFAQLEATLDDCDVIVLATSAAEPIVYEHHLPTRRKRLVLDLAVPQAAANCVREREDLEVLNIDLISERLADTEAQRQAEIPKAQAILEEIYSQCLAWYAIHRRRCFLHQVKANLNETLSLQTAPDSAAHTLRKAMSALAHDFRQPQSTGCQSLQTLSRFLPASSN